MTNHNVLQLNANWTPMGIISWERAIMMWWNGRVEIVKEYDDFNILSFSIELEDRRRFSGKCPAVVRLLEFCGFRKRPKYNRINILKRDNFTCQYCGYNAGGTKGLNLDHVVPKSQGGKATWDNIVSACVSCNSRKRNRTPWQAKMVLKQEPKRPSADAFMKLTFNIPKTPEAWRDYLYWVQELENDNDDD